MTASGLTSLPDIFTLFISVNIRERRSSVLLLSPLQPQVVASLGLLTAPSLMAQNNAARPVRQQFTLHPTSPRSRADAQLGSDSPTSIQHS